MPNEPHTSHLSLPRFSLQWFFCQAMILCGIIAYPMAEGFWYLGLYDPSYLIFSNAIRRGYAIPNFCVVRLHVVEVGVWVPHWGAILKGWSYNYLVCCFLNLAVLHLQISLEESQFSVGLGGDVVYVSVSCHLRWWLRYLAEETSSRACLCRVLGWMILVLVMCRKMKKN